MKPKFDTDQYLSLLGLLVHWYAAVESLLRAIFQARVGLTEETLDAIMVGGTPPVSRLILSLKRLNEVQPLSTQRAKVLAGAFEQLGHISSLRDRFVHAGGSPFNGTLINLEPLWKHRKRSKLEDNLLDPQLVTDAITDLQAIMSRLGYAYEYGSQEFLLDALRHVNEPWKYAHRVAPPGGAAPAKRAKKGSSR
jgi:hypothetical protein